MRKVLQTRRGADGNCLQACLATILGVELDEVCDFVNGPAFQEEGWLWPLRRYLRGRGIDAIYIPGKIGETVNEQACGVPWERAWYVPGGLSIASVIARRGHFVHAVVCFDGDIIHDPSGLGLRKPEILIGWTVLTPLDREWPQRACEEHTRKCREITARAEPVDEEAADGTTV